MPQVAAGDFKLSIDERELLELVYSHFDGTLTWPEPNTIKRQLYQRWFRRIDLDALLSRLMPDLVREVEFSGRRLRLTLYGFRALLKMVELSDFVCFLRLAIDKYGQPVSDKAVSTADVVKRCGLDAHRLGKLDVLLDTEPFIAHRTKRGPDGGPFEWGIDDEITRYHDAFDIDTFLVIRRRELEELASAEIPPVHLLSAEGVPIDLGLTAPFDPSPSRMTSLVPGGPDTPLPGDWLPSGLHRLIEAQARPQVLIGKYDVAVFAALRAVEVRCRALGGFGNDLVGVDLMNRAFGPNGPLVDASVPKGEQEGMRALFAGPYAVLRNPAGHRDVDYDDVEEAADGLHTASLLMRILDRVEKRLASSS